MLTEGERTAWWLYHSHKKQAESDAMEQRKAEGQG